MKSIFYSIAISLASFGYGCNNSKGNLSLNTTDTNTSFKFSAEFDEDQNYKVEKYLDSTLNVRLNMTEKIDSLINLSDEDMFRFKAKNGFLEIDFDKRNSSFNGYMKVKNLAEGIQNSLTSK